MSARYATYGMRTPARKRKREGIGTVEEAKDGRNDDVKDDGMDDDVADIAKHTGEDRRSSGGEEGAEVLGRTMEHRNDRDTDHGNNGANEDGPMSSITIWK